MAALTAARPTVQVGSQALNDLIDLPVKASTKCIQGGIAVIDAGYAAPGRTATGLVAAGVFMKTTDNSSGAAGALRTDVRRGTFKFANSAGGDAIAQAEVGTDCYIVDDQTVAKTNGGSTRSVAGKVVGLDSDGAVHVHISL